MVSPVSRASIPQPVPGPAAAVAPGKSSQGVGQQAKAAIADSGMVGLPSNIQGKVASMLARGLDPTSLLTPAPPPPPPADPVTPPDGTTTGTTDGAITVPSADGSNPDTLLDPDILLDNDAATPPLADPALPADEAPALTLLAPVTEPEANSGAVDILMMVNNQAA